MPQRWAGQTRSPLRPTVSTLLGFVHLLPQPYFVCCLNKGGKSPNGGDIGGATWNKRIVARSHLVKSLNWYADDLSCCGVYIAHYIKQAPVTIFLFPPRPVCQGRCKVTSCQGGSSLASPCGQDANEIGETEFPFASPRERFIKRQNANWSYIRKDARAVLMHLLRIVK